MSDKNPDAVKEIPDCAWCGGECEDEHRNRGGEIFCSKNHRSASNRALKRFVDRSATATTE